MKILITNDLYDIASRIKEIDDGYYIVYDNRLNRYEVHSTKNLCGSLCLVVPYGELDCRTLQLVRYTAVENSKKIFEDIERSNAAAQAAAFG